MSKLDDLQTERIPAIDDIPVNRTWKPILQAEILPTVKLNGRSNSPSSHTNNKNNGTNCTTSENPIWSSPLLKDSSVQDHNKSDEISHKSNNNEWSQVTPSIKREVKNGWKEIPQDGDVAAQQKVDGNALINGKNGVNGSNGHEKLAELDPLTGERKQNDLDESSNCGIGSCQPKWARLLSSTHVFMVDSLMAWILQGMYYTYFVSVITTIEKLFQIKSKTTGLLMSATEIGQIVTALFCTVLHCYCTYYAGRGHRPRWIACGMVFFAFSAFGCTLPHFIFGNQLLHAKNAFYGPSGSLGPTSIMQNYTNNPTMNVTAGYSDNHRNLCKISDLSMNRSASGTECQEGLLAEQAAHSQITSAVLVIFSVSLLGVGVGQTAVSTLRIAYIDDNVASRESPIYIAITIGVRILGPAFGFILGSFCTRIYVDISDPGFGPSDPKWIGAWYLDQIQWEFQIDKCDIAFDMQVTHQGIYFSDMFMKSAKYANVNNPKYVFLCEVALGTIHPIKLNYCEVQSNKALPSSCHSLKTIDSKWEPDPASTLLWKGLTVPVGQPIEIILPEQQYHGLDYNEFVVFNQDQVKLRYLIQFED